MSLSLLLRLLISDLLFSSRLGVEHESLDTVGNGIFDTKLLFLPLSTQDKTNLGYELCAAKILLVPTYIVVVLFKCLPVVEVLHGLLLVPAFDVGEEVDAPCEIAVVIFAS